MAMFMVSLSLLTRINTHARTHHSELSVPKRKSESFRKDSSSHKQTVNSDLIFFFVALKETQNQDRSTGLFYFVVNCKHKIIQSISQAEFAYGGSILGSSQFMILPQVSLKTMLDLKVVKIDSKIITSLNNYKFVVCFWIV